jgi:hypothetical protein
MVVKKTHPTVCTLATFGLHGRGSSGAHGYDVSQDAAARGMSGITEVMKK